METHFNYFTTEEKGRIILSHLIKTMYNHTKYDIHYYLSDPTDTTNYDGFVTIWDKETGRHIANHILEIKVRDRHYEGLMYEKAKHEQLQQCFKRQNNIGDIIYITVTPKGAYVFNTTKLEAKFNFQWIKEEHNKTTVEKEKGKTIKPVTYLSIEHAKHYPQFHSTFPEELEREKTDKIKQQVAKQQRTKCLYQWMLTTTDLKGKLKINNDNVQPE